MTTEETPATAQKDDSFLNDADNDVASEVIPADQIGKVTTTQQSSSDELGDVVPEFARNGIKVDTDSSGDVDVSLDLASIIGEENYEKIKPVFRAHNVNKGDPTIAELFDGAEECLAQVGVLDEELKQQLRLLDEQTKLLGVQHLTIAEIEEQMESGDFSGFNF